MELSITKQKILLLLMGGLSLGLTYSPHGHIKIIKGMSYRWKKIEKKKLEREIKNLYSSKMIKLEESSNGILNMVLSDKGKLKTLNYHFEEMRINFENWDKKWRIVIFDIPEKLRKGRDAIRDKLKKLGFYELQKSAFVIPYDCKDEIEFLVEFFDLKKYVRFGTLDSIDNEIHLKKIFGLK